MMYSAMLLASLLASAHGFAATPTVGNGETFATEMECKEYAFYNCRYPTCGSNEDCAVPGQDCLSGFCKFKNICPPVSDGAGGIRYEVECS